MRAGIGQHVFGCDICQDVCPWNSRAPVAARARVRASPFCAAARRTRRLTEDDFRSRFRGSPIQRAKYAGFLRNVAIAMGNSGLEKFREPLERLAAFPNPLVAEQARWALRNSKDRRPNPALATFSTSSQIN